MFIQREIGECVDRRELTLAGGRIQHELRANSVIETPSNSDALLIAALSFADIVSVSRAVLFSLAMSEHLAWERRVPSGAAARSVAFDRVQGGWSLPRQDGRSDRSEMPGWSFAWSQGATTQTTSYGALLACPTVHPG